MNDDDDGLAFVVLSHEIDWTKFDEIYFYKLIKTWIKTQNNFNLEIQFPWENNTGQPINMHKFTT